MKHSGFHKIECLLSALLVSWCVKSADIHIPGDYPVIQDGIDAAVNGDRVLIADGSYSGQGNVNLDFHGKSITVMSENGASTCIINCENSANAVQFVNSENSDAVLQGLTFLDASYGGITCSGSSPVIVDCRIESHSSEYNSALSIEGPGSPIIRGTIITGCISYSGGAAVGIREANPLFDNCEISANEADHGTAGIRVSDDSTAVFEHCRIEGNESFYTAAFTIINSAVLLDDCLISGNSGNITAGAMTCDSSDIVLSRSRITDNSGPVNIVFTASSVLIINCQITGNYGVGGMLFDDCAPVIRHCTIAENTATYAGISCIGDSDPHLWDSIIWGNTPEQIYLSGTSTITIEYSDIQGGYAGDGNIDADPLFAAGPLGGYYLSHAAAGQADDSPCIDAGSGLSSSFVYPVLYGMFSMADLTTRTDLVEDDGMVDMGFHYPTLDPTSTPYPTATRTQTPTATDLPTGTPTPAVSQSPAATFTAEPTGTPGCGELGVKIWMPAHHFSAGDPCECRVTLCNPGSETFTDVPLYVVLQVADTYFFAPEFDDHSCYSLNVPPGSIPVQVVELFDWPADCGEASGIFWHAGMLNATMTGLLGDMDTWEFGWDDF